MADIACSQQQRVQKEDLYAVPEEQTTWELAAGYISRRPRELGERNASGRGRMVIMAIFPLKEGKMRDVVDVARYVLGACSWSIGENRNEANGHQ